MAGREFAGWAVFEAPLEGWRRERADRRVHGTPGETPLRRFARDDAAALQERDGRPPFRPGRAGVRRGQPDGAVALDGNRYSVPWRRIGESVPVIVVQGRVQGRVPIRHHGQAVAVHAETPGRHQRIRHPAPCQGGAGAAPPAVAPMPATAAEPALLRPLAEDGRAAGGGWS
jgi:hypothetical protein